MKSLKPDTFICGYDNLAGLTIGRNLVIRNDHSLIFSGKTSDISEEMAKECVESLNIYGDENGETYAEYNDENITWSTYPYLTAKESILSACDKEYSIIFKQNK